MEVLDCGNIQIPACFVQSISWAKRAHTIKHYGGYISSYGFETAEISVKASFDVQSCGVFGYKADDIYQMIQSIHTDRVDVPGVFRWFGYSIYPELEFALTNINKTYISDGTSDVSPVIECDMVFSGVKAVKNVNRERALNLEPERDLPGLKLVVDDKELVIQDNIQINTFITTFDSITLELSIGSDMDLVDRDAFLLAMIQRGIVYADLPQGQAKYYIIDASLSDEQLSIVGSVFSRKAAEFIVKTYQQTDLQEILKDICRIGEIECNVLVGGYVDYYKAFGAPLDLLRELQQSAGFLMSFRQGVLTIAGIPDRIYPNVEVLYNEIEQDSEAEPIVGVYWYDGNQYKLAGSSGGNTKRVQSAFASSQDYSDRVLKFLQYTQKQAVLSVDLMPNIDAHAEVYFNNNGSSVNCIVEFAEFDWMSNTMRIECHSLG